MVGKGKGKVVFWCEEEGEDEEGEEGIYKGMAFCGSSIEGSEERELINEEYGT